MSQWFIETRSQIEGPYSTEAVQSRLQSGQVQPTDRIWGRMLDDWKPLSWWSTSLSEIAKLETKLNNPEVWHYAYNSAAKGPLSWPDLIEKLKMIGLTSVDQLIEIKIWTRGMKEWAPLTEFHELMDAIGVNKRESARAAIGGQVTIKSQGLTYLATLRSIGDGGFGTNAVAGLLSGEHVTIEIKSPALSENIHAKAEVRYMNDQIVGFKFTQINVEARGAILQYVHRTPASQNFFIKAS